MNKGVWIMDNKVIATSSGLFLYCEQHKEYYLCICSECKIERVRARLKETNKDFITTLSNAEQTQKIRAVLA